MWLVLFCITVSLNSLSFCSTLSKNRFDMWKSYQKHLTGSTLTSGKKESTTLTCLSKTMQKPFIYKCSDESASFTLVSVKMKFFLVDFESIICSLYHHSWLKVPNPLTRIPLLFQIISILLPRLEPRPPLLFLLPCFFDWMVYRTKLKGYLRYKIITSQNVSPEAQVKNFFVSQKSYFLFSRYLSSCIFNYPKIYKICDVIISISTWDKVHFWLYRLN